MRKVFYLVLSLLLVSPIAVIGQQDVKSNFLSRLKVANKGLTSIDSEFIQEKTMSIMTGVLTSSGKFYYKKPNLMKWDQLQPSPYYFILNGNEVKRFDGKTVKVISANSPQVSYFKDFIMGTVDGSLFESEQFEASYVKVGGTIEVTLIPLKKSMKKRIKKMVLVFDNEKLILLNLTMFEAGGDQTAIKFVNTNLNTITDNSIFE